MSASPRRVVISGLGPVTPAGVGIDALWELACNGGHALSRIQCFDASGFRSRHGGEITRELFNVRDAVPKSYRKATKVMARDIEFAVGGAAAAVADAGLVTRATTEDEPTIAPDRMGCHIGAGLIAADIDELTMALSRSTDDAGDFDYATWGREGMGNLTPLWLLKYLPNMLACHVTIIHDCQGPSNTITCAESSATLSVGESLRVIQRGAADACLTGGCDSKLNPMALLRQQFAGRLAETGDDDATAHAAVRPYASDADGTLAGEGGGILVMETLESVQGRGGRAYAEIAGAGAAQSACPDTVGMAFAEDDPGLESAIRQAIRASGLEPSDIDAIVPSGTGIPAVDAADRRGMEAVFGERLASIPLILPVSIVGLCGAGIGAVSLALAAKAIEAQRLPARVNVDSIDGLDAAASPARDADLRSILVFTTSLGGPSAAGVLTRHEESA
ncbi:MAG: beta-ketoacyl synthase N-terminal-like domain-containing protein [Planctomycetota bacterium]|nr:beta-ketoacyl synthase N-terminal-like domain-containing protein [Planctomycetota bacterium]